MNFKEVMQELELPGTDQCPIHYSMYTAFIAIEIHNLELNLKLLRMSRKLKKSRSIALI